MLYIVNLITSTQIRVLTYEPNWIIKQNKLTSDDKVIYCTKTEQDG